MHTHTAPSASQRVVVLCTGNLRSANARPEIHWISYFGGLQIAQLLHFDFFASFGGGAQRTSAERKEQKQFAHNGIWLIYVWAAGCTRRRGEVNNCCLHSRDFLPISETPLALLHRFIFLELRVPIHPPLALAKHFAAAHWKQIWFALISFPNGP